MCKWLLVFFLAIIAPPIYAVQVHKVASQPHKPYILVYDTVKPNLRSFNNNALSDYRRQTAFNYYVQKNDQHLSLWDRFWNWFWDALGRLWRWLNPKGPVNSDGLRYVVIGAAVILLIWVIIKYVGADVFKMFAKKDNQVEVPYQESLENIHEINFDDDIQNALAQRNYKLAVRLLYLRSLKQLNDAGLINWQIEKTNSVYIEEIVNADQRQTFSILTRQFEYVWYGDFPVDEPSFNNIDALFQDFKKIIK